MARENNAEQTAGAIKMILNTFVDTAREAIAAINKPSTRC
jgi:hypothetical protein